MTEAVNAILGDYPWSGPKDVYHVVWATIQEGVIGYTRGTSPVTLHMGERLYQKNSNGDAVPSYSREDYVGTGKFIDQFACIVVQLSGGKEDFKFAWHTLASLCYAAKINPTDGLIFNGTCPSIGLPTGTPEKVSVITNAQPMNLDLDSQIDKAFGHPVPKQTRSFDNWSAGDLKAERDKRRKGFNKLWADAQQLWAEYRDIVERIK